MRGLASSQFCSETDTDTDLPRTRPTPSSLLLLGYHEFGFPSTFCGSKAVEPLQFQHLFLQYCQYWSLETQTVFSLWGFLFFFVRNLCPQLFSQALKWAQNWHHQFFSSRSLFWSPCTIPITFINHDYPPIAVAPENQGLETWISFCGLTYFHRPASFLIVLVREKKTTKNMVVPLPPPKKNETKFAIVAFWNTTPTIRRSVSVAKEVDLDQANLMTPKTSWNATRDAPRGTPLAPDKRCHEEGEPGKLTPGIGGAGGGMLRNDRMIGGVLRIHEFNWVYYTLSIFQLVNGD